MLLSFKIKNFKSIKNEIELNFEATADKSLENSHVVQIGNYRVLKLCAIYGPNASGKTNILIALNYLRNLIVNSATRLAPNANTGIDPFIFDPETRNGSGEFEITFIIHEIKYVYNLKLSNKTIQNEELKYYPKNQPVTIYTRKAFEIDDRILFKIGQGTPLHDFSFNSKNELKTRKNIPYISSVLQIEEVPILKEVYDWFDKYLNGLIRPTQLGFPAFTSQLLEQRPEYKEYILSILSSSSFGNITEIIQEKIPLEEEVLKLLPDEIRNSVVDDKGQIFANRLLFKHTYGENSANLPFDNESQGTKRYYELSGPLALLIKNDCMFPIDEFDTSIHTDLQAYFLEEFFRHSKNSQLLITTHNTQLMDLGIIRRDEIWFTDKNLKDGSTTCYSLSDIRGVRKEGSYRKQYNAGKFGAKPKIDVMENF